MAERLSPTQRKILAAYNDNGDWRGRNTQALEGLLGRGLLERRPAPIRFGEPVLQLTAKGRAAL